MNSILTKLSGLLVGAVLVCSIGLSNAHAIQIHYGGMGDSAADILEATVDSTISSVGTSVAFPAFCSAACDDLLGAALRIDLSGGAGFDTLKIWETKTGSDHLVFDATFDSDFTSLADLDNNTNASNYASLTLNTVVSTIGSFSSDVLNDFVEFAGLNHQSGVAIGAGLTIQSGSIAPVPEPATIFLLGSGLLGLAVISRRKKGLKS